MKVLMIVTCPELGGTETHVLHLAQALMRLGMEIGVATSGGPFAPHFEEAGMCVHHVVELERDVPEESAQYVASIVRQQGYNVVHVHDEESIRLLPILRESFPELGIILTVHGKYITSRRVKRYHTYCNHVITVSTALCRWLVRADVPAEKITVIPNGIDTETFIPADHMRTYRRSLQLPVRGKIGLYVGRFQSDKVNIAQKCMAATARIAPEYNEFTMVLIGYGEYSRRLRREAAKINEKLNRQAVMICDPTLNIAPYYRASTFVIGTGRVALEAMSCGKPVIAMGIAGYDGLVIEDRVAKLCAHNFGDHDATHRLRTSRLASDMRVLLSQAKYRKSLGEAGRRIVLSEFSIHRTAGCTREVYYGTKLKQADVLWTVESASAVEEANRDDK